MWDWEIASSLRAEGVETIAPYSLEQIRKICRGLGVKRELKQTKFLVFQDNPGRGFQGSIFKRFDWWEDECARRMMEKFGITIVKKSFQELGTQAKQISDQKAEEIWKEWQLNVEGVSPRALRSRHDFHADEVHPGPVTRRADYDDQPVPVSPRPSGAETRKDTSLPRVKALENHFLVARCGYLGVVPTSFSTE